MRHFFWFIKSSNSSCSTKEWNITGYLNKFGSHNSFFLYPLRSMHGTNLFQLLDYHYKSRFIKKTKVLYPLSLLST